MSIRTLRILLPVLLQIHQGLGEGLADLTGSDMVLAASTLAARLLG